MQTEEIKTEEGRTHLLLLNLLPVVLIALAIISEYSGFDIWWVSFFYDSTRQLWPYTHHWLFDDVIHSGGQYLDRSFILVWLAGFIMVNMRRELASYRKICIYFLVASALGPALVGIGKNITHIYSPWDLELFGGIQPYIRLFDKVPDGAPPGHAFPAGHAAGGYCFVSLYFVFLKYRCRYRVYGLVFALMLGLVFGVAQQVRGAHFPSHDMATLVICWYVSMYLYFLFYPQEWQALAKSG